MVALTGKPQSIFRGGQVHYADDTLCFASRGLGLHLSRDGGVSWEKHANLEASTVEHWLTASTLYQRLLRKGVILAQPWFSSVAVESSVPAESALEEPTEAAVDSWIAMWGGSLYKISTSGQTVEPFWSLRRGRRTLRHGLCIDKQMLYIGDYWPNPERTSVNIYRINLTNHESDIFYQFPANSIRHVHNVEIDPFTNTLWFSTGDVDDECQVGHFELGSEQPTLIGQGSQQWRAVSFIFRENAVYWGTDNPDGENQIWRYDRKSCKLLLIGTVKGPIYYSKNTQDYIVFSTAVEFGHGEQDRYGRLYAAPVVQQGQQIEAESIALQEVLRKPKDVWHPRYFGYGLCEFNAGDVGNNQFWITYKGLKGGLRSELFELNSLTSDKPATETA